MASASPSSSSFVFGTQVKISGLTSESGRKLNNRIGTVLGFAEGHDANTDPSELRYEVHILRQDALKNIRPANLATIPENCYVVRNTGTISGRGMFATRDIAPGEQIIREASLVPAPADDSPLSGLSDRALKNIIENDLSESDRLVAMKLTTGAGNSNNASSSALLTPAMLRTIAKCNAFSFAGLVFCCSMFNHSCCGNATYEYDVVDKKQVVYATRPIKAGEEIMVCYTGDLRQSQERQIKLMATYGFMCKCPLCTHKSASLIDAMLNKFWEIYDAIPSLAMTGGYDKCETLCEEAVVICDRLTQAFGLVEMKRRKALILNDVFQLTFQNNVAHNASVAGTADKNHPAFTQGLKYLRLHLAAADVPGCFPPNSSEHQKKMAVLRDIEKNPSKYVKYVLTNTFPKKVTGKI